MHRKRTVVFPNDICRFSFAFNLKFARFIIFLLLCMQWMSAWTLNSRMLGGLKLIPTNWKSFRRCLCLWCECMCEWWRACACAYGCVRVRPLPAVKQRKNRETKRKNKTKRQCVLDYYAKIILIFLDTKGPFRMTWSSCSVRGECESPHPPVGWRLCTRLIPMNRTKCERTSDLHVSTAHQ